MTNPLIMWVQEERIVSDVGVGVLIGPSGALKRHTEREREREKAIKAAAQFALIVLFYR
jgi:hypothetical protein